MVAIEYLEAYGKINALKEKRPQGRMTKKLQAELAIREKAIDEVLETLKTSVRQRRVVPLFQQEVQAEFPKRQLIGCEAGYIYDNDGTIAYETFGARETFAIGMPMYDQEGKMLGRLTLGFHDNLSYRKEERDGKTIEIPCEYWRIAGYTPDPDRNEKIYPLTYYQLKARTNRDGHLNNYLYVKDYIYKEEITWGGKEYKSYYNHGFYYSSKHNDLILVECEEDTCCCYYRVGKDGSTTYLGLTMALGLCVFDHYDSEDLQYCQYVFAGNRIVELNPDEF